MRSSAIVMFQMLHTNQHFLCMSFPGMLLSSLGPGASYRGQFDRPNYQVLMTDYPFDVDGRIMGWYFYAYRVGQARFQVISPLTATILQTEKNPNR